MDSLARALRLLGEPTRLRILRLIGDEPLTVSELTTILGLAQPSVSKQLGELRQAGLVHEERNGLFTLYRLKQPADGPLASVWDAVAAQLDRAGDANGDRARKAEVLRGREDRGAVRRMLEPGRSWPAWARTLGWLIPPLEVADLGCGDGALTAEIARWAGHVTAVDRDAAALKTARQRLRRDGCRNVSFRLERIEKLSLPDDGFDVVVLSQALHEFEDLTAPLRQARRILKPGGRLLLLDLAPHSEEWVVEKLGHVRLGFRSDEIHRLLQEAGLEAVRIEETRKGPGQAFRILAATAVRPSRRRVSKARPAKEPRR